MKTTLTLSMLTGLMLAASGSPIAQAQGGAPASVIVRFADLELARDEGARRLYARIQRAAREVCGHAYDARMLGVKSKYRACYRATLTRAVDQVNAARVSALHWTLHRRLIAAADPARGSSDAALP